MKNSLFNIEGKVIVITGGYGVLGKEFAAYLSEQGAKVVVLGRDKQKGEALVSEIRAKGYEALFAEADVLDKTRLEQSRDIILDKYGKIDVLINTAGGNMPGATIPPEKNIFDLNLDDLKKVVDLNFFGTVLPSMIFAKPMVDSGQGNIINIASVSSLRPLTRVGGYGAAKASVANFTQFLAGELNIKFPGDYRINALIPGFFLSDQNRDLLLNPDGSYTDRSKTILAHTPYGRFGEANELLGSVHYLVSDASRFVTGTLLIVDGGFNSFSI
jgi:NAD(P)-dependent dehydrogenase (short-subunit alcohol dehydrogenase family)